jgi:hypothetical protein
VVRAVHAALGESEAVMARIDVEEEDAERPQHIVADAEAEHVLVERQHVIQPLHRKNDVPHAKRPGAEPRDIAPGLERIAGDLGAVKNLEPVADRVVEDDQVGDAPLLGERARGACNRHARSLDAGGDGVERRRIRDLPAEEAGALATVFIDDQALPAVVHAERERLRAFVHKLHAEQIGAEGAPIFERLGTDANIAQALDFHASSPSAISPFPIYPLGAMFATGSA